MKENIALIGLMGSGKTTIGRHLLEVLDMNFVDIDKVIEERELKTIPQIFEELGEEYFRKIEAKVIAEESAKNNLIISTGGGCVLNPVNLENLKKKSYIIFLDPDSECILERVKFGKNRPLLNNIENLLEKINELDKERRKLYESVADLQIKMKKESQIIDVIDLIKKSYINS
ncbi:MAG: shikimate kinase [Fusobacteriaceae bacterium]